MGASDRGCWGHGGARGTMVLAVGDQGCHTRVPGTWGCWPSVVEVLACGCQGHEGAGDARVLAVGDRGSHTWAPGHEGVVWQRRGLSPAGAVLPGRRVAVPASPPPRGCCRSGSDAPVPPCPQECSGLGDMPGSFVPTVTAITTSQDLQWLVQPTLISSVAQSQPPGAPMAHQPPVDPYDLPGPSYSTPGMGAFATGPAPPPPPPARSSRARPRRSREETVSGVPPSPGWLGGGTPRVAGLGGGGWWDTGGSRLTVPLPWQLTPEEEEKRRVRRERNKLAAAKCRNRRRELTDRLQAVSVGDTLGTVVTRWVGWGAEGAPGWWRGGSVPSGWGQGGVYGAGPRGCVGTAVSPCHRTREPAGRGQFDGCGDRGVLGTEGHAGGDSVPRTCLSCQGTG